MLVKLETIAAGTKHTAFLKKDGSVWTVGSNCDAQLGDGTIHDKSSPVRVLDDVVSIAAGSFHTAFLKIDGSVWTVGANYGGQLGHGKNIFHEASPVRVLDDVVSIAAGGFHTAFLKKDGGVWTVGRNTYGQLGDGTTSDKKRPVRVLDDVVSIAVGSDHTAFLKKDGSVWTVGANDYAQLGDGTTSKKSSPVRVLDDVVSIAAGAHHTGFLKKDGSVWTVGGNTYGQLGDGTTNDKSSPVRVLDDVVSIAAGSFHTAFLKKDGSVWTAGRNFDGQLGDGTTSDKSSPVRVLEDVTTITEEKSAEEGAAPALASPSAGPSEEVAVNVASKAKAGYVVEPVPASPSAGPSEEVAAEAGCAVEPDQASPSAGPSEDAPLGTTAVKNRIFDAGLEHGKDLSPIAGLFPADLTIQSLDICLSQVQDELPKNLKNLVRKARRKAHDLRESYPNLTEDDRAILTLYSMEMHPREQSLYFLMNSVLRDEQRKHVRRWRDTIYLLLTSMRKLPKPSVRVLHRGTQKDCDELGKQCIEGEEFVWNAFSSCTTHVQSMADVLGEDGPRVKWVITLRDNFFGRDISPFSLFPSEREVLLGPQTEFKVISRLNLGHGLVEVQLEEIEQCDPLIDPLIKVFMATSTDTELHSTSA